ncbi:MAG: hypothetical protein Kow0092_05680 [Deferrisomatales bacterium]
MAGDAGTNLRSDDKTLYFTDGNGIRTVPTDAPPVVVDFQADALEVIQVVQNPANQVRLVADKPTHVRGYAHVETDSTGKPSWFPAAGLRGFRGTPAVELAESPLWPVAGAHLDDTEAMAVPRPTWTGASCSSRPTAGCRRANRPCA